DRVQNWTTFNELEVIVAGYIGRGLAPGLNSPRLHTQVGHNLLLAHGRGVERLRWLMPSASLGIVLNLVPVDPVNRRSETIAAARTRWDYNYGWYLDG